MSDWGKGAQNNTIGWGQSSTNSIGYGSIYETSYAGDTALIGTSAAFLYSKSSFNQGEADPTPTITGTTGGSFNASANVVFVDTGTFNSSTGQIDLSATSIGSHIITYTVNGVQSGQTVGVTAIPYASTSSFTFDGVNDYFDAGLSLGNAFGSYNGELSFSGWINPTLMSSPGFGIFHIGDTNTNGIFCAAFISNNLYVYTNNVNQARVSGLSGLLNKWSHLAIVWDTQNASNSKIYIDNVEQTIDNGGFPTGTFNFTNKQTRLGFYYSTAYTFRGGLDELSIWNTALSQSAVTEIYNSGAPNDLTTLTNASNTNLKAWYKF